MQDASPPRGYEFTTLPLCVHIIKKKEIVLTSLFSPLQIQVDPYLGFSDDLQVYVKPDADVRECGSAADNRLATSILIELRDKIYKSENVVIDILVQNLTKITKVW